MWYELLEWLIEKGARKFLIATENFALSTKLSHQINKLLVQKKATIVLTSIQQAASVKESEKLIEDANKMGPLEGIFFVSLVTYLILFIYFRWFSYFKSFDKK